MGKKSKNTAAPNAPELQQILLEQTARQPPRNPYYPNLGIHEHSSHFSAPPPYSDLSTSGPLYPAFQPMSGQPPSNANYSRLSHQHQSIAMPHQQPTQVVVRSECDHGKYHAIEYTRRVRKFNNELLIATIVVIALSIYANHLYAKRPCTDYLVAKPAKDISINVFQVRDFHLSIAAMSALVFVVTVLKCCCLGNSKSHSCYLFIVGLLTLVGTLATGALAYLAFYSPCTYEMRELFNSWLKTLVGSISDQSIRPDLEQFNESNVFKLAQEDRWGLTIFLLDMMNFALYLGAFIGSLNLC